MPPTVVRTDAGFHPGELAVQRRAGVVGDAARLVGMLTDPSLDGGIGRFLSERDFAVLTARDARGRLWISPLFEAPGFLVGHGTRLSVHGSFADTDPLAGLPAGQPVGLLAIEFATRRRVRINGRLERVDGDGLQIEVEQAYGNCPKYISPRRLAHVPVGARPAREHRSLTAEHTELITRADTFFLGTTHPERGSDASHRGGTPGFVRVEDGDLWFPDYSGNNMFNSLGNLAVDDTAALLFLDVDTGAALHLTGRARVEWTDQGTPGDDGRTGRRVRFTPSCVVDTASGLVSGAAGSVRTPPLS